MYPFHRAGNFSFLKGVMDGELGGFVSLSKETKIGLFWAVIILPTFTCLHRGGGVMIYDGEGGGTSSRPS